MADGNTWWYQIASSPWNNSYYASADAFYNNGATSGSLVGTPFVDPAIPICGGGTVSPPPAGTTNEINGGSANTWTDYADAGGMQGPTISTHSSVAIACKIIGFRVADGNTWWYQIASSPWNGAYYVSADAFYNDGASSGSLIGTPFVDTNVPTCDSASTPRPSGETTGGPAQTWANYSHAGAAEGPTIPAYDTVQVSCRVTGFRVADGNTWWYLVSSSPWNGAYYVSADAFYNNGATSGTLIGSLFVDTSVPICANNQEAPIYSSAYGSSSASSHSTSCISGDPIDCASGDFWQTFTDVSIPGRGPGLSLTRTYNDLAASVAGVFGNGWSSSYDQHLTLGGKDGSILVTLGDGSQMIAEPNGSGGFTLPTSTDDTLELNENGTYTLTEKATQVLTFSSTGLLMTLGDLNGYETTLAYNGSNQLTSVTDSAGRTLQVNHGPNGLVSSVVDPMGRTTAYAYDGTGNLVSVTDPLGRITVYSYNADSQMLTMTDPKAGVVSNTYDAEGRVISQTDPAGRTTTYAYTGDNFSSLGGTTTITDPRGIVEVEQYANGFFMQAIKAYGTPEQATYSYAYDPATYGLTSTTDPNGNVTTHTYNATGQVLSTTDALNRTTANTYNSLGEVLTTTTPKDEVTTKSYNGAGDLLTSTDPSGGVTAYTYGDSSHPGDVTSVSDPNGDVTTYTYDSDGDQVSKSVSPSNGASDTTMSSYDADGEQVCQASADAFASGTRCPAAGSPRAADTTSTVYDADGEPVSVTDPRGNTTSYRYDSDGNKISETEPSGSTTTYTYDADNELTNTAQANGAVSSSSYDSDGNVASTTAANGEVTTNIYDALNHLTSTMNPLGETTTYTYDVNGNRVTTIDPSGRTTSDYYDADNELTGISYSDGTTPNVTYNYDADGQRTSMTDGTGTTTYSYNDQQQLSSSRSGTGQTVSYVYDPDGNLTSLTYPNEKTVTEMYDRAGNLVSVTDWLGHKSTFAYDADANLITQVEGSTPSVTDTYTYDSDDAVTSATDVSGRKTLQSFAYARNSDGLVSSVIASGKVSESYSYDSVNQLAADTQGSYSYNTAGDITQKLKTTPLTYNAGEELTSSGKPKQAATYTYDPEGDRTSVTPYKGSAASYRYDQAGRLISLSEGSTTASYTYNGDGLRMSKQVDGALSSFAWNVVSSTPLLLTDGTSNYIYGPGGLPLESISISGAPVFYHHNQVGSTTMLTSAAGKIVATFAYDSYGSLKSKTGSASTALLYTGQYEDAESGLYYMQARYYDPVTAQFMSVDPAISATGQPFSYADDNPANIVDPQGQFGWSSITSFYDRNEQTISDTVAIAGDALALASLVTPAGFALDAVRITAAVVADASIVTSCSGSVRSSDCVAAIGGIALGAIGLKLPGSSEAAAIDEVGTFLVQDVSEIVDVLGELVAGSSGGHQASGTSSGGHSSGSAPSSSNGTSSGGSYC